ncbi:hypothetical protein POM88_006664 [Heracleum sosnowskyi]|uniref:Uncharacterized protein n=1 Tax=Heracleum sosnowskyi TaxID=360622 RepID=A0AAD8J3X6_9APIA|nr:hypothetical protein POM88_006664 [Heracleum sosnowskyi]
MTDNSQEGSNAGSNAQKVQPTSEEALETIALLAGVTENSSTILSDTILNVVKRGQVVPVVALLLLARERVLRGVWFSGNMVSRGPSLWFPEAIMNELAALINQEVALMGCKEHAGILQMCREKKEFMVYVLQLIEIFNRAGPALESYLETRTSDTPIEQVFNNVAELLKDARFTLSAKDTDTSDITSSPKPDPVPLDATMKQQGHGYIPTYQAIPLCYNIAFHL